MSPGPATFAPAGRERVDASATSVLLRVAGTWSADGRTALGTPVLEVLADGRRHAFAALPDPGGPPVAEPEGLQWRGAFALPRALADAAVGLRLSAAGAEPAVLVTPPGGWPAPPPARAGLDAAQATADLAAARAQLADARALVEDALADAERHDQARVAAEAALDEQTRHAAEAALDARRTEATGTDPSVALADVRYALQRSEAARAELQLDHDRLVGDLAHARRLLAEQATPVPPQGATAARLHEAERERDTLRETLARHEADATRGAAVAADQLERRVADLDAELLDLRRRHDEQTHRVVDLEAELAGAVGRARDEAEARDVADARAATVSGEWLPARARYGEPSDAEALEERRRAAAAEGAAAARVGALEAELGTTAAEAQRLHAELTEARALLRHAAERLRDETELRMRAESRSLR